MSLLDRNSFGRVFETAVVSLCVLGEWRAASLFTVRVLDGVFFYRGRSGGTGVCYSDFERGAYSFGVVNIGNSHSLVTRRRFIGVNNKMCIVNRMPGILYHKKRHRRWVCWMSMGRKNGSVSRTKNRHRFDGLTDRPSTHQDRGLTA